MRQVYIIRHAKVQMNPSSDPTKWILSDEGIKDTRLLALRENWNHLKLLYHSPEPKAEQTAAIIAEMIGAECKVHPDLRDLEMRTGVLPTEEFQSRVCDYLLGKSDLDFENYEAAQLRIRNAVHTIVNETDGSVGIVSHGRIITAFFSDLLERRMTPEEWRSITFPDVSVIDIPKWKIVRGFFSKNFE